MDRCIDGRKHAGYVFKDLVIPESQDTIAVRIEIPSTYAIRRADGVLAAVYFDDNSQLVTGKVGEVRTDRRLASKVMLLERRLTQVLPELLFGFGRVAPQ